MITQDRAKQVLREQAMDRSAIQYVMHRIPPGSEITVRFKQECPDDLMYLRAMANANVVELTDSDMALAIAVYSTRDWEFPENRVWSFKAGTDFRLDFFEGRMLRAIDYISVG